MLHATHSVFNAVLVSGSSWTALRHDFRLLWPMFMMQICLSCQPDVNERVQQCRAVQFLGVEWIEEIDWPNFTTFTTPLSFRLS